MIALYCHTQGMKKLLRVLSILMKSKELCCETSLIWIVANLITTFVQAPESQNGKDLENEVAKKALMAELEDADLEGDDESGNDDSGSGMNNTVNFWTSELPLHYLFLIVYCVLPPLYIVEAIYGPTINSNMWPLGVEIVQYYMMVSKLLFHKYNARFQIPYGTEVSGSCVLFMFCALISILAI